MRHETSHVSPESRICISLLSDQKVKFATLPGLLYSRVIGPKVKLGILVSELYNAHQSLTARVTQVSKLLRI